jgi:hypothetical protein
MRVFGWVAAGLGLGACGGFVAGLLRDRPEPVFGAPIDLTAVRAARAEALAVRN